MSTTKSEKELAFLRELYVSTDWGERFAHLIDDHLKLPKKGSILYLAVGTGGHAIELKELHRDDLLVTGIDESEECLDLARAKAIATNSAVEFISAPLDCLPFDEDVFDVVVAEASLIEPERLPHIITEMLRVAAPGATVAMSLATAFSFGEFYSIYWEALQRLERDVGANFIEDLITAAPTVDNTERMLRSEGLDSINSRTLKEEFSYASGEDFLNAPLIADFLLVRWLEPLPQDLQQAVTTEIASVIDEFRHDMDFTLSVKATFVVGRKEL